MNSTSELFSELHAVVRSLEKMRNDISAKLVVPGCDSTDKASDRAQLSDLHRRISAALDELSAEARQM